ncbi:hypothetical protein [Nonomuraea coxensis]|uniref:hypothetical protein n=1 Tax=Nonomuraea coxensis TaxID=404386 RepID=UPI00146BA3A5|nr:hypothetical protein [Nonomuraea coxensis]
MDDLGRDPDQRYRLIPAVRASPMTGLSPFSSTLVHPNNWTRWSDRFGEPITIIIS